jgi:preprotein translocase subunit SecF
LGYVTYFDRLTPAFAASPQVNSTSASQIVRLKNIASNQSSDIKEMKELMSQEVQLLKGMGQEFSKTTTKSSFAALGVSFLGMTLVIFWAKTYP